MIPGQYVRFAYLPADSLARPRKVVAVYSNGTIRIEGSEGVYKAFLFVVVEEEERAA